MGFRAKRKLHEKFKFEVLSRKFGFAAFQKMSELSYETARIDYFEGGALIPIKDPGRVTYADVTLERGSSQDRDMFNWALEVADASRGFGGRGLVRPNYDTSDLAVLQRDRDDSILRAWDIIGAWPMKFVAGDWDNTVDEVVIESLTLTYDYFVAGSAADQIVEIALP